MARIVVIESPYAGCIPLNEAYLEACIRDTLRRGESQYASHKMLTKALDDLDPAQRKEGIDSGIVMRDFIVANGGSVAFYLDLGWSGGMKYSEESLVATGRTYDSRLLLQEDWFRVVDEARDDRRFRRIHDSVLAARGVTFYHLPTLLWARDKYVEKSK